MKLRTGESHWTARNTASALSCTPLAAPARCDVLVIGGGISGALAADLIVAEGLEVIIVDQRDFADGSTAASTALLMYEIDTSLTGLAERYGWEFAARCYQASLRGLQTLAGVAQTIGATCDFAWRKSLYLASSYSDVRRLGRECDARRRAGIEIDLLSEADITSRFPFSAPAALLSRDAAEVDPVRLTRGLLHRAIAAGVRAHGRTRIVDIQQTSRGLVVATQKGPSIRTRMVVICAGYEAGAFLDHPPGTLHSTFVACSRPMASQQLWHENCLIWETSRPYCYMRTSGDGRAIIGGADVRFKNTVARDAMLPRRTRTLERRFAKMFPDLPFETDFAWTGTFGESDDGLPWIGPVRARPGCLFAMGYGGNGITWAMLAAEIIRDHCLGRTHADAELFGFDRS